jgi:hypothetical protein
MNRRIGLCIGLIVIGLLVAGCSGGYQRGSFGEIFENGYWTYKDGYSGDWRCEITANGEWYGSFSGAGPSPTGLRELRGDGNAVVFLPDNASARTATVGQKGDNGPFSIRIIGPGHSGELITGTGDQTITTMQKD